MRPKDRAPPPSSCLIMVAVFELSGGGDGRFHYFSLDNTTITSKHSCCGTKTAIMSDQSQTTANTPSEPVLCKMGCGFFGNPATSGCCSKCWRDNLKKQGASEAASPVVKKPQPVEEPVDSPMPDAKPDDEIKPVEAPAAEAPKKKKGKKKLSYKAMMKDMMVAQSADEKAAKEKDALRKVTGGGAFQKIEKI